MMHFPSVPVVIVAALSRGNRALGYQNKLLWHLPEDLKHFKKLTLGHPVIMGRKTFESIVALLGKPLPGRTNIIVTRTPEKGYPGAITAGSLEAAFAIAESENPTEIHIGGGAELYNAALPYVDRLHLTLVDEDVAADTFFPDYVQNFDLVSKSEPQTENGHTYTWNEYVRKNDSEK